MKSKYIILALAIGLAVVAAQVVYGAFDGGLERPQRPEFSRDEIVIKLTGESRFRRVRVGAGERVEDVIARYRKVRGIEYAEPNYIARAFFTPNDPYYSYQWNLDNSRYGGINMESAWDVSSGNGVTVAIVDTGIAYENYSFYRIAPDLKNTSFVPGYDFVGNDPHPNDENGHGTHVAGTIAQSTDNNLGVAGVAFGANIMPVRVLDRYGGGTYADVADGIRWAADNGADVINLSLGGSVPASYLEDAARYAYEKGVVVVAASGNDGAGSVSYPAAYDNYVIAVGATRFDENRAPYSNYGSSLDIMAPGGDLSVDQNNDGYGDGILQQTFSRSPRRFGYYFYQGTSMASPHVAGVAALVLANGSASTPDEVRNIIQSTADDLGSPGRDNTYGWGLVNAAAALGYSPGPVDNPPGVSVTSPINGSTVSGSVSISADASDDIGVDRVDFFVDGVLVGSDSISPYEILWDSANVGDGSRTIKATVVDTIARSASDSISVTVDNVNDSPVANAGSDQILTDNDNSGSESATLNGSASYDTDGSVVSYEWKEGSAILGTTAVVATDFAVGAHTITLTIVDDGGAADSDNVVVTVNPKPTGPEQVFFDNFQSGNLGKWVKSNEFNWTVEKSAERKVPGSQSGNLVAHADRCSGSGGCVLTVKNAVDLSGYSNATLKFWRYVDRSLDKREFLKVEVYDGSAWSQIFYWTHKKGDDDRWHRESFDLSGYLTSDFKVRFTSKESSRREETEIDDVLIEASL